MTKNDIRKNFLLDDAFTDFLLAHPGAIRFPKKGTARLVLGSTSDPDITRKNLEIAYEGMRRGRKPYFQAIKYARTWRLVKVRRPTKAENKAVAAVLQSEREMREGKILRGDIRKLTKRIR